jgi:hypothetical protein
MSNDAPGPITFAAILISGIFSIFWSIARTGFVWGARARARGRARADERTSRRRQQQWLDGVRRQKARGEAGDATQDEARAALRGRGGRQSELDERFF